MTRTVVAVVAHPDDESLIAGGTLALAARAGAQTGVVSLTRGEHGPSADPAVDSPERLAEVREAELAAAGRALGVDWVTCLRYPDGELPWIDQATAAEELASLFSAAPPDIVLTFGPDGLYGHPDHTAAAEIARTAIRRLGLRTVVDIYEAAWPPGLVAELAACAARRGLPHDLWGLEPEAFGSERDADVAIDVRPVLAQKLAALRAHRTQFGADHLLAALPLDLAERFLDAERWAARDAGRLEKLLAVA
jgi:LmbE family N-acetylglucosaminyl deacetylase